MFISLVNSIHAVTVVIVWSKTFTILTIGRNLDILHVQLLTKVDISHSYPSEDRAKCYAKLYTYIIQKSINMHTNFVNENKNFVYSANARHTLQQYNACVLLSEVGQGGLMLVWCVHEHFKRGTSRGSLHAMQPP